LGSGVLVSVGMVVLFSGFGSSLWKSF